MVSSAELKKVLFGALVTVVATVFAYLASGGSFMWVAAGWQIAFFAGAIAGLAAPSPLVGIACGPATVLVAALIYPPWYVTMNQRGLNVPEAAILLGVSAAATVGVVALRFWANLPMKEVNRACAIALLALVLANVWITPLTVTNLSAAQNGSQLVSDMQNIPQPLAYTSDAEQYLRIVHLMQDGMPYYDAVRDSWLNKQGTQTLPWGVVSYRLPTIFWLWKLLPSAPAMIPAFLFFMSIAVVAAFLIPTQLGLIRLAPVAAALVAGNYMGPAVTTFITYVDPWAMALTLAGLAVYLYAEKARDEEEPVVGPEAATWIAVGLLVVAALIREILIYVPLLAAVAAFAFTPEKRWKATMPWLVGIGVFAVAYLAHVLAIGGQVADTQIASTWSRGSVQAMWAAIDLGQKLVLGLPWVFPVAIVLGAVGAWGSERVAGKRFMLVALCSATIPLLSLMVVGNPGVTYGDQMVNYWGMLCIPINLALAPAATLLLMPRKAPAKAVQPKGRGRRARAA